MPFGSSLGTVGVVKPTFRPGSLEEFIRLLPEGIGVIPLFMDIRRGTREEFAPPSSLRSASTSSTQRARRRSCSMAPRASASSWRDGSGTTGVLIITVPMTQVEAMRALGMQRIAGRTYFVGELNDIFARYFTEAGFDVLAMKGIAVPFEDVGGLAPHEVRKLACDTFRRVGGADGGYLLGSGWRTLDVVAPLEEEFGVPVLHPVPARVWAVMRHFNVGRPIAGRGRLLAELPPMALA